ncbi:MAG: universal stress protein [ANME-2 cluster archaeon]|nr:universal stress protein [ANME-2 cluster archaeon]
MVKFQFLLLINEPMYSEMAVDNAIKLARIYNAEISIMYVVDSDAFKEEEIKNQTEMGYILVDKYKHFCEKNMVSIKNANVIIGTSEIIKIQKEIDASLIILGVPKNKLGSIAEKVVKDIRCHVLIAREKTAGDEPYDNILVPVDGSEDAEYAARFAASIAHRSMSKLTMCHIIHDQKKMPEGKAIIKKVIENVKSKGLKVESFIREGKIAEEILKAIDEKKYDLTVIGYIGRGRVSKLILGSVSEKVIHFASSSVFVVKSLRTERVYTVQK